MIQKLEGQARIYERQHVLKNDEAKFLIRKYLKWKKTAHILEKFRQVFQENLHRHIEVKIDLMI